MTLRNVWQWIAQRFYGALDNVIATLILTGVGYLFAVMFGLLPGIVISGPFTIPLVTLIIVMLSILILTVLIFRFFLKKTIIIRPIRLRELKKPLDFDRLGLSQYIYPDSLIVDNTHMFLLIQQIYLIDGYDGVFVLRYHGKNATNQMSQFFRDSVVGDSAVDISLMEIKVVHKDKNVPARWKILKDEPYEKLIEIYFLQPLNFGDEFDIEFSCRWPGTFTRREDYVFYPIHYYKHGVKKLIAQLILNMAPNYVEGIRFDGKKALFEPVQPQIQRRKNKYVVTWEIENPKHIYILQYGRQDIV